MASVSAASRPAAFALRVVAMGLFACGARTPLEAPWVNSPFVPANCDFGPADVGRAPTSTACSFESPLDSSVVMAAILDRSLVALTAAGAPLAVHRFHAGVMVAPATQVGSGIVSAGRWVFAASSLTTQMAGPAFETRHEFVLFDTQSRALRQWSYVLRHQNVFASELRLFARREGLFAASVAQGDHARILWFFRDGRMIEGPVDSVALPGALMNSRGAIFASIGPRATAPSRLWVAPCEPRTSPDRSVRGNWPTGSRVLELAEDRRSLLFRDELTDATVSLGASMAWVYGRTDGVSLLGGLMSPTVLVVNRDRAAGPVLQLRAPDGFRQVNPNAMFETPNVSSAHDGFGVTSEGHVTMGWRSEAWGGVFRTTDGQRWERLGPPWRAIYGLKVTERAGTYWIHANANAVRLASWVGPAPDDVIDGPGVAWIRPAANAAGTLSRGETTRRWNISSDGRCVWSLQNDGTLRVLNTTTGMDRSMNMAPDPRNWQPAAVWLPDDLDLAP